MCLSAPDIGAVALAKIDPEVLLTSDVMRRAARHLKAVSLSSPLDGLPPDDPELAHVIADLVDRAARGSRVTADHLEHARLLLERARIERELRYQRDHGGSEIIRLSGDKQAVQADMSRVLSRIEKPV
jgi:hypothetical protein